MKHAGWIVLAAVVLAASALAAWTDAASEDANPVYHGRVAVVNTAGEKVDPATGQTESAAHTSGDGGVMPLFVHLTTRAALAADGKYGPGQLTSNGDLRVRDDDLLTLLGAAGGGAYVRQDSTSTIALESGGNLAAAAASLAKIDDWDESDRAKIVPASGLPVYGLDAAGADAYAKVLDAPARVCHYAHVSVAAGGAVVSFDGGSTDHVALPPNTSFLFEGLAITTSAEVHGKNLSAGSDYTNLRVSVW